MFPKLSLIKGFRSLCFLGVTGIFISINASAQGFVKTDGKRIIKSNGANLLLKGIGLGGWMVQEGYMLHLNGDGQQYRIRQRIEKLIGPQRTETFYNEWLANHTTKADIDSLHAWGFNSVRLPMHYNLFTLGAEQEPVKGKNTWLTKGFTLIDSLIAWCKGNGMYLILDLHAAPGGQGNDLNISDRDPTKPSLWQSEANKEKTIELWRIIAARYMNETTVAAYDMLNEPNWGFEDSVNDRNGLKESKNVPLRKLLMDITAAIRTTDTNHFVIIEGNGWGNNYNGILPAWDKKMVLSFHKYWNYNDAASIQHILKMRDEYNVPVWLGETGENSNTWFTEAISLLEANNIGWAWWPLKKLGNNNPLEIRSNPVFDSLTGFWNGTAATIPDSEAVYSSLMQLAAEANCIRNIKHPDVIDAMMRQPNSLAAVPFSPNIILLNTVLPAVVYDLGIVGSAYYDLDTANYRISSGKESAGNYGRKYRNDGVDIYEEPALPGSYYIGKIETGEWTQYSIDLPREGMYKLALSLSSPTDTGMIAVFVNDEKKGTLKVPRTGSLQWQNIELKQIRLEKGISRIRILAVRGGYEFKNLVFVKQ